MRPDSATRPTASLQRTLRTTAIGATVTALAAAAHAWAGAALPHPLVLAALVALTALASTAIARLPLRLPPLVAVLGAGQLALHAAFTALGPGNAASPSAVAALTRGRHQHSGDAFSALASLGPAANAPAGAHDHSAPAMLVLHAAATLACAVVIRGAERALAAMAEWLQPLVRLPQPAAVVPETARPVASPRTVRRALSWHELAPPPLRGPPAAPASA